MLPPGEEPDARRRRRARWAAAVAIVRAVLILWGGNTWWEAEADSYGQFVLLSSVRDDRGGRSSATAIASR